MRKGMGKYLNYPTKTGKKLYNKFYVYVPSQVANDATFPFKVGDKLEIEIKDKELAIRKA